MKVTNSAFSNSASSTTNILVFTSEFYYLPTKEFVSLVTTSDRFQIYGFKRLGMIATSTTLVNGEWLNLNLISQKIPAEEFYNAEAAVIFIMPTDLCEIELNKWFRERFKEPHQKWQEPQVLVKGTNHSDDGVVYAEFKLNFFVDDIKLENGRRGDRASSQIYQEVLHYLKIASVDMNKDSKIDKLNQAKVSN